MSTVFEISRWADGGPACWWPAVLRGCGQQISGWAVGVEFAERTLFAGLDLVIAPRDVIGPVRVNAIEQLESALEGFRVPCCSSPTIAECSTPSTSTDAWPWQPGGD